MNKAMTNSFPRRNLRRNKAGKFTFFVSKFRKKYFSEKSKLREFLRIFSVKHLSTLLSEAELDVARLTEMNTMLKEELRRQERSTEREKQMQNLEYMKNVIFKVRSFFSYIFISLCKTKIFTIFF